MRNGDTEMVMDYVSIAQEIVDKVRHAGISNIDYIRLDILDAILTKIEEAVS